MTEQTKRKIELGWVSLSDRLPPEPDRYLIRRDLSVTEMGHGLREIKSVILSAFWDGEKFNTHAQPGFWRDLPKDMRD